MNKVSFFLALLPVYAGCGSGTGSGTVQKQSQAETAATAIQIEIVDTSYIPRNLLPGSPHRGINPAQPPRILDLRKQKTAFADFDLAGYFHKSTIRVLEYPPDSGAFVKNKWFTVNSPRYASMGEVTTSVKPHEGYLMVSDAFNGILQYDSTGKYSGTVYKPDLGALKYNKRRKMWEIPMNKYRSWFLLPGMKGHFLYATQDSTRKLTLYAWNPKDKKTVLQKEINYKHPSLVSSINDTLKYRYRMTLHDRTPEKPMLFIFNEKGDTLVRYKDYIPVKATKRGYTHADDFYSFYSGNDFHFRQPYNDTIFKVVSAGHIEPVYILNFGERKMDIQTGYFGDKTNFLVPWQFTDLGDALLITYSQNYDCGMTRKQKTVHFYYALYDKKTKSLLHLDMKEAYPEQAWLANSLPGSLPVAVSQLRPDREGKVYVKFFKEDLDALINSPSMKKLPPQQQETVLKLAGELNDRKIAVMVLE